MIAAETLSDKYEDQYKRLEKAMIELFKYENLLNNEYLVRKFESDDMKPDWYLLQYVVVQRENSIKNQYVQNEQNNRKQYHLILTAILKEYNKQLWNFDPNSLLIRPYFPSERKRIQIKLPAVSVQQFTETLSKAGFVKEEIVYEQEIYQADKTLVKLILTCQTESYADEIFTWLMSRKVDLHLDTVMMQNVDYLEEFHKQINQKKCAMIQNKKSEFQQPPHQDEHDPDYDRPYLRPGRGRGRGRGGYGQRDEGEKFEDKYPYRNDRNDRNDRIDRNDRNDRNERNDRNDRVDRNDRNDRGRGSDRRGGNRERGNNQYIQKNEYNQQQQQQQQQQYHLVPKTVLQKTPKQNVKTNTLNTNDFPALDAQQS